MSRILNLAQTFSENARQDSEIMTEKVKLAIEQHENDLKAQLADASRSLSESIQAEQMKLIRRTVSVWKLPFIIMGVLMIILAGISLFLTYWSVSEYQNLTEWKRSAEIYQTQKSKRLCAAVDPKYQSENWGEKNEPYRILAK
ncbi:MbeB family mobilization protein [Proteus mirabilis]|uniref:MbeB family mobilization protein n=1 Tax=Proteus mirabilis TaxID=584 RepID=UPI00234AF611|nr:MbeB family mobilization protein [Proteus mirabilis]MDC5893134.1 MbeB family mobilization protein [Proteus mirabilis]